MPFKNVTIVAQVKDTYIHITTEQPQHGEIKYNDTMYVRVPANTPLAATVTVTNSDYKCGGLKIYKKGNGEIVVPFVARIENDIIYYDFTPEYDIVVQAIVNKPFSLGIKAASKKSPEEAGGSSGGSFSLSSVFKITDDNNTSVTSTNAQASNNSVNFVFGAPATYNFNAGYANYKIYNLRIVDNDNNTLYSIPKELYKRTGEAITFTINFPETLPITENLFVAYDLYKSVTINITNNSNITFETNSITAYAFDDINIQGNLTNNYTLCAVEAKGQTNYKPIETKYTPDGNISFIMPNYKLKVTATVALLTTGNYASCVINRGSNNEHINYPLDTIDGTITFSGAANKGHVPGSPVSFTLSDSTFWKVNSATVTKASTGEIVPFTGHESTSYTFIMPNDNVIIYPVYTFAPMKLDTINNFSMDWNTNILTAQKGANNTSINSNYKAWIDNFPYEPNLITSTGDNFITLDNKQVKVMASSDDELTYAKLELPINLAGDNISINTSEIVRNGNYIVKTQTIAQNTTPSAPGINKLTYYLDSDITQTTITKS